MKKNPVSIGVDVPANKIVQSASVGNSASVRQRKPRQIQSLKKTMKDNLARLDAGLR